MHASGQRRQMKVIEDRSGQVKVITLRTQVLMSPDATLFAERLQDYIGR
jgi:hypothetical protein